MKNNDIFKKIFEFTKQIILYGDLYRSYSITLAGLWNISGLDYMMNERKGV